MKLVRDLIPTIIMKSGRTPLSHIAGLDEYKKFLRSKLQEEFEEFCNDESMEEIADILEVIEAICTANNYKLKEVLQAKKVKKQSNGSFNQRIILEKVL